MTNAGVIVIALICGWIAAWPARRQLEPLGWVLVGLPVGLFSWSTVAFVTTVVARPWSLPLALLGLALFTAAAFGIFWKAASEKTEDILTPTWGLLDFAVAGAGALVMAASAFWFAHVSRSVFTFDSFSFYEPYGSFLKVTGVISASMMSSRGVVVPAVHAAGRLFGGEWHFVLYPMAALTCSALVVWGAYRLLRHGAIGRWAVVPAGAVALVMNRAPQFALHSIYVHSHVVTALYLMVAIVALMVAYLSPEGRLVDAGSTSARKVWLAVAGFATAGIVLARPDGLAYAFVPIVMLLALDASAERPGGSWWFHAPAIGLSAAFVLLVIARQGLWVARSKLSGDVALAIVIMMVIAALVNVVLSKWTPRLSLRAALGIAAAGASLAVMTLLLVLPEKAIGAVVIMVQNLVREGAWGPLWIYAASASVVVLACAPLKRYPWLTVAAVSVGLFFAAALVVHGAAHPGRLGFGDSFNRVSFHAMPLVFLLIAGGAAAMVDQLLGIRRADDVG